MLTTTEGADPVEANAPGVARRRTTWPERAALIAIVLLVASPIVIAELATIGRPWTPLGDVASMVYRTSQVFTSHTPLVGAYTSKGMAHPGPLTFWVSAPWYRLSGGDPRALLWTAGFINCLCIAGVGAVGWRRGRWPLFLGLMALTAVLVHGIGADVLSDSWNPFVPLLPFLLGVVLLWDAALGRRRALVEAVVPLSYAMQAHLAFVTLTAVLGLWLLAWTLFGPRLVSPDAPAGPEADALRRPLWAVWRRPVLWSIGLAALLWAGPVIDALFDVHNPLNIARSLAGDAARLGLGEGLSVVGRYLRPDGPWMGGPEPTHYVDVVGSGPLGVFLAIAVLVGCLVVARRRRLRDVAALSTMMLALVVASVPAVSQLVLPAMLYLTQWLKIVGGLVWFTLAWTIWRCVEPSVVATPARRALAMALPGLLLIAFTAGTWGQAAGFELPSSDGAYAVRRVATELEPKLSKDEVIQVEHGGDTFGITGPGIVYQLIHDGYHVRTRDGSAGLKWGHEHRLSDAKAIDRRLVIAIHRPGSFDRTYSRCVDDPRARSLVTFDGLTPAQRSFVRDVRARRLAAKPVSATDLARARRLDDHDLLIGVFDTGTECQQR